MAPLNNGPGFWHRNPISRACSKTQTFVLTNLLLEHNTTKESIEAAMPVWFLVIHKTAAIEYS